MSGNDKPLSGENQENTSEAKEQLNSLAKDYKKLMIAKNEGKSQKDYKFWKTQPVPQIDEDVTDNCAIEPDTPIDQIPTAPLSIPSSFEWCLVDLDNDGEISELQALLLENYVEDTDSTFRLAYSHGILRWGLCPPGYKKDWHLGIRVTANKKLVAFIGGIPMDCRVFGKDIKCAEINFLCIHKKLRSKRLAPVLIKEITRRVHLCGIFQAVYTAGSYLPKPFSRARYYHRSINPKKLIEVGFSYLRKNMTMARTIKLFKLPPKPQVPGFRPMKPADLDQIHKLYELECEKLHFHHVINQHEASHFLSTQDGVLQVFVVEDGESGKIVAFSSFYLLNNQVLHDTRHRELKGAMLWFHHAPDDELRTRVINDTLTIARDMEIDVLNALDIGSNSKVLDELKFRMGDGVLNFYLYNWKCPEVENTKQGFVII